MLKILQTRLQQYMNCELPDVQAVFKKAIDNKDLLKSNLATCNKHLKICSALDPIRPKGRRRIYIQSYSKKFIDNGKMQ